MNNVYRVGKSQAGSISIRDGHIVDADAERPDALQLVFDTAVAFPGFINSHDHLDFNLFPQLGNRIYHNYTEWGYYIHQTYQQEIAEITRVPVSLRAKWGLYKNLLAGVTTVVNHGDKLPVKNELITVIAGGQSLHSVQFEKKWKVKLNHPLKGNIPVAIHTGEGTDKAATDEIDQLINWNLLNRELIGIHGVAMTAKQARRFKALVWCPQSNYYLLGETAKVDQLKTYVPILFGTDSTLTSNWNIWEHIRQARETRLLTDDELLASLTINPAEIWKIHAGQLSPGYDADIVVARLKDTTNVMDSIFNLNPEDLLLVLHKGNVRLFDESLYSQLNIIKEHYSRIMIGNTYKYVYGDLPGLMTEIKKHYRGAQFPVKCCHELGINELIQHSK